MKSHFKEIETNDMDDIMQDPHKYGAPTFEEFKRNPDKWRVANDQILQSVTGGSSTISNIKAQHYEIAGYKCKSLEEVERVARDEGISLKDLDMYPQLDKTTGGKLEVFIKFEKKKNAK
jgi:hypothetical protein